MYTLIVWNSKSQQRVWLTLLNWRYIFIFDRILEIGWSPINLLVGNVSCLDNPNVLRSRLLSIICHHKYLVCAKHDLFSMIWSQNEKD